MGVNRHRKHGWRRDAFKIKILEVTDSLTVKFHGNLHCWATEKIWKELARGTKQLCIQKQGKY